MRKQALIFDVLHGIIDRGGKERLIARIERLVRWEGDCLIWTGAKKSNGYGAINFRHDGKHEQFKIHAVFATLMTCAPIPDDMEVDHICNNRLCVRHLRLVTRQENLRVRDEKRKRS